MPTIAKTMKLHIHVSDSDVVSLKELTERYREACDFVSQYVFDNGFITNFAKIQEVLYTTVRSTYGLKAQMTISVFKTVTARYKTVQEQLYRKPYTYLDENGSRQMITRTLDWLMKPIRFSRPQADLVRTRDYSFTKDKRTGENLLSLNTLGERIKVSFDVPECFEDYFNGSWKFGTGKIVSLNGEWYFHIPMTKELAVECDKEKPEHVVGIDRGLRFLATTYDEKGNTEFYDGKSLMRKRAKFQEVRSELQSKGTKSAKRALKRISGRENRWMSDVNHQISKTLVQKYGENTLFVVEDLRGVSFDEANLKGKTGQQKQDLRTWTFYQFEQFLSYKAHAVGSEVLKVRPDYTSQRCPKCGRIHKENRHHDIHEYICDACRYRSNDDRIAAMNIQLLGTMHISGDTNPRFGVRKVN